VTRSFSFSDRTPEVIGHAAHVAGGSSLILDLADESIMTKRRRHRGDRLAAIVLLAVSVTAGGIRHAASDEPRKGWFTPRCAERDIQALAVIESFSEIDAMPAVWLANAGLNYLQARLYCLSNEEGRAIALYDRIIAGDARMSNELALK
jgi:hypothetical protein